MSPYAAPLHRARFAPILRRHQLEPYVLDESEPPPSNYLILVGHQTIRKRKLKLKVTLTLQEDDPTSTSKTSPGG